jgi:carboxynorspermidine decarboxylase
MNFQNISSPCYVCDENILYKNLNVLNDIQEQSGAKILLSLKGFSSWSHFTQIAKNLTGVAASGLWEAQLGREFFPNSSLHTAAVAYKNDEFIKIVELSDFIIFNSFSQWQHFKSKAKKCYCGIRINPEFSKITPRKHNPCASYSRLGVTLANFNLKQFNGISGLHLHTHSEQNSTDLLETLIIVEKHFSKYLYKINWINLGGGQNFTSKNYNVKQLVQIISNFKEKYNLDVYFEPSQAVTWQAGFLITTVLDVVYNDINIAILDISKQIHLANKNPKIKHAKSKGKLKYNYRLGGITCLANDIIGDYSFNKPLKIGDKLIIKNMLSYSLVKNNTFNGIKLPSLGILTKNNKFKLIKNFTFDDYKNRLP